MPIYSRMFILCVGVLAFSMPTRAEEVAPNYALVDVLKLPGSTRWDYLTLDAPSHRLFITRGDSVDVLDTDSKKIVGTIQNLEGVHGVALAPALHKGFITEGKANRVTVFDLTTYKTLTTIPTGTKPDAIVYDDATQRIFAANGESGDLTVIDAVKNTVLGTVKLNGQPEFAVVDDKGKLYVNLEDKSQIAVVDIQANKAIAHYDLVGCEGPTGLAIDKAHNHLFSVCANKVMVVVDAGTGKIIDTLVIGQHSDAAIFDPGAGQAFSSNGEGTLTVVGAAGNSQYAVMQNVPTKTSARTMALDPSTHTIYLAAAETEGFDPPTDKHPEPRPHIKPDTFMILIVRAVH